MKNYFLILAAGFLSSSFIHAQSLNLSPQQISAASEKLYQQQNLSLSPSESTFTIANITKRLAFVYGPQKDKQALLKAVTNLCQRSPELAANVAERAVWMDPHSAKAIAKAAIEASPSSVEEVQSKTKRTSAELLKEWGERKQKLSAGETRAMRILTDSGFEENTAQNIAKLFAQSYGPNHNGTALGFTARSIISLNPEAFSDPEKVRGLERAAGAVTSSKMGFGFTVN